MHGSSPSGWRSAGVAVRRGAETGDRRAAPARPGGADDPHAERREPWRQGTEYSYLGDRVPSISPARALVLGMLSRRQMYGHQVLRGSRASGHDPVATDLTSEERRV